MTESELRQTISDVFALKGVNLPPSEVAAMVADFMATAAALKMRDSDEIFGFMIVNEAYKRLNEGAISALRRDFGVMEDNLRKGAEAYSESAVKSANAAVSKAEADLLKAEAETQKRLAAAVSTCSDKVASAVAARKMSYAVAVAAAVLAVVIAGVAWISGSWQRQSGYAAGVAETKNAELVLQERDAFWETGQGRQVEALKEAGKLADLLAFAESLGGRIAMAYKPDVLTQILTCRLNKDWQVRQTKSGKDACFPGGSGFFVPEVLQLKHQPTLDELKKIAPKFVWKEELFKE